MILTGRIRITKPYSKSSKHDFFKDLTVGTIVKVQAELKYSGRGRSGMYSPTIKFSYKEKVSGELKTFSCTWNHAVNYIKNMME